MKFRTCLFLVFLMTQSIVVEAQVYASEELRKETENAVLRKGGNIKSNDSVVVEIQLTDVKKSEPLPQNLDKFYKLKSLTIGNYIASKSSDDLSQLKIEAEQEVMMYDYYIDLVSMKFIKLKKSDQTFFVYKLSQNQKNLFIDCETCDLSSFEIIKNENNRITLSQHSPDSKNLFKYIYDFTK
jgi:hypothetical protein